MSALIEVKYPLDMPNMDLPALYAEFESRMFPESWTSREHGGLTVASNAGGHAIVLAESEDFYDDDGSAARAAWEHLEPLCRDYEVAATSLWGSPHTVDITDRLARGESSPFTELLLELGTIKGNFWDRGERALGLAVCQMDKETAIQVIAFVVSAREL